jgi:hypothetical protein
MLKAITFKITAFLMVFILLANNINTLVIIGDFIANQDYIAKTLCIQKEEQKGCNGKCQLRKELSENNSNTNPSENPLQESKRIVLDAFCFFTTNKTEIDYIYPYYIQSNTFFSTPKIKKLYLEIDTPPPNFS